MAMSSGVVMCGNSKDCTIVAYQNNRTIGEVESLSYSCAPDSVNLSTGIRTPGNGRGAGTCRFISWRSFSAEDPCTISVMCFNRSTGRSTRFRIEGVFFLDEGSNASGPASDGTGTFIFRKVEWYNPFLWENEGITSKNVIGHIFKEKKWTL